MRCTEDRSVQFERTTGWLAEKTRPLTAEPGTFQSTQPARRRPCFTPASKQKGMPASEGCQQAAQMAALTVWRRSGSRSIAIDRIHSTTRLRADNDPIVDLRYTGGPPGGSCCLLAFGPRPHGAPQDHLTPVCFDGDAACVDLGRSSQGFSNLAPDFRGCDPRLDFDGVGHPLDPAHPTNCLFRTLPLVVPLDFAFERKPAILRDNPDLFPCIRQLALDPRDSIAGDLGVRPLVDVASACACIFADGTALVESAGSDMGPGTYTSITQVAADTLGLPPEYVRICLGDSALPPAPSHGAPIRW
jgi:hypothetical protein